MRQVGADLVTGNVLPYELSRADIGGEGSMTRLKHALVTTSYSDQGGDHMTEVQGPLKAKHTKFKYLSPHNHSFYGNPRYSDNMDDILISGKRLGPLETSNKSNRKVVPSHEKSK